MKTPEHIPAPNRSWAGIFCRTAFHFINSGLPKSFLSASFLFLGNSSLASQLFWLLGEFSPSSCCLFPSQSRDTSLEQQQGKGTQRGWCCLFCLIPGLGLRMGELFAPKARFPFDFCLFGCCLVEITWLKWACTSSRAKSFVFLYPNEGCL